MSYVYYIKFDFDCKKCNYSCTTKTKSGGEMLVRLHKKKCKATGRTMPKNTDAAHKKTAKINSMSGAGAKQKFITGTVAAGKTHRFKGQPIGTPNKK